MAATTENERVVFTVTWEINLSEVSVQGFWDTYACYGYNKELLCTRARTKAYVQGLKKRILKIKELRSKMKRGDKLAEKNYHFLLSRTSHPAKRMCMQVCTSENAS
jgi:hypothetical protein